MPSEGCCQPALASGATFRLCRSALGTATRYAAALRAAETLIAASAQIATPYVKCPSLVRFEVKFSAPAKVCSWPNSVFAALPDS